MARRTPRPLSSFDVGLQHERTSLAWERTAISLMVAATLLARYAAEDGVWVVAAVALLLAVVGGAQLVWSGVRYDDLHGPLREGTDVTHSRLVQLTGLATVALTAIALALALWLTVDR